ncbi:hypothetical protein ACFL18_02095 [Patescibacteria group bacterium]
MSNLKKLLPILAIVAVVGVGAVLLKNKGVAVPGISKTYTAKGIKAIVDLGVPVKCSYQVGEMEYEGYVKGKQYRGKMQYPDGKQGEVIMKDECMWSWSETDGQGIKMCFPPTEDGEDIWDNPENANVDINYLCRPAAITDAQFVPPANINFMDMDDMDSMMDPQGYDYNTEDYDTGNYDIPAGVPDSPEDFDMSRYQE